MKQARRQLARQRKRFERALRKHGHVAGVQELDEAARELTRREIALIDALARTVYRNGPYSGWTGWAP